MTAATSGRERRIAFAECEHVCPPHNHALDHFHIPLHARNVQRSIAKISRFVDVDASVDENLGGPNIAPSRDAMLGFSKVSGCAWEASFTSAEDITRRLGAVRRYILDIHRRFL